MARTDLLVSVVMPLHEDARIIGDVVRETSAVLTQNYTHHEIILVADGSDDATLNAAQDVMGRVPCVRLILLSRDFGREMAVLAGLETSIGDYVVILVPETDPPDLIPKMISQCRELDGMVNGVDEHGDRGGPMRRLLKSFFHGYMRRFLKTELLPGCTDFRVLSRRMVNALTQFRESYRQLRLLTTTVGYRRCAFPYTPLARSGKDLRKSFFAELHEAIEITVAHSRQPLRLVSLVGWFAGFLNVLYVFYAALIYLFKKDVAPGWTTLSVQHGVMFFFIFSLLAILSEYVGRILEESRGRPLYLVSEEKKNPALPSDEHRRNVVTSSK